MKKVIKQIGKAILKVIKSSRIWMIFCITLILIKGVDHFFMGCLTALGITYIFSETVTKIATTFANKSK